MRAQRKTIPRKRASAGGTSAERRYLEDLLAGIESSAPGSVAELVAAGKIGEGEHDEWLEPIRLSVRGVRNSLERMDPVGAAVAMHFAQLYVSGLTCLRREIDTRRYRASEAAKAKGAKIRKRDRDLLAASDLLMEEDPRPEVEDFRDRLAEQFGIKSTTIERRLRELKRRSGGAPTTR